MHLVNSLKCETTAGTKEYDVRAFRLIVCTFGDRCKFSHDTSRAAPARMLASVARPTALPAKGVRFEDEVEWILDTGTGNDLCPIDQPGKQNIGAPILLNTANGVVSATATTTVALDILTEDSDCIALHRTVRALSIGRRCVEHGYEFSWKP